MINNLIKSTLFLFIFLTTFVVAQDSATKREINRLNAKINKENVRVDSLDAQIRLLLPELQNALKANLKAILKMAGKHFFLQIILFYSHSYNIFCTHKIDIQYQ